jgi:twitching motility protein PilT
MFLGGRAVASLDKILHLLVENRMESLLLEPGRPPRLTLDGQEHAVTRQPLPAPALERLLRELDPGGPPAGDAPWRFDHSLNGHTFHFEVTRGAEGWTARAVPAPAAGAAPAGPPVDGADLGTPEEAPALAGLPTAEPPSAERRPLTDQPLPHIDDLLREMVSQGASDLHVSPRQPVYMRVDGELRELSTYETPGPDTVRERLYDITPKAQQEEFEATGDVDFSHEIEGVARFRVNYYLDRRGLTAAFRVIPSEIPGFDDLGLPKVMRRVVDLSKGLVLVTGPTGSGKSTTLAALLDLLNRERPDHIITIEDPIEFVHPSRRCLVHQRQVGLHTESFAKALRAALREDPDIVLVGEMRDLDTTSIAIQTAETGHLVFGTLHTTSAISTIDRLIDQYPPDQQEQVRLMLAESLKMVVSQILLKKKGGGRVAAFEVLLCTPAVSNLIREGKSFQIKSLMQTGRRLGMCLLNESLLELIDRDLVHPEEAYRKAADKTELVQKLQARDVDVSFADTDALG